MNLSKVENALKNLNNGDKYNTDGACEPISVLAANSLVDGSTPSAGSGLNSFESPSSSASNIGALKLFTYPPDKPEDLATRAFTVWAWLKYQAQNGVYVFAQDEDHCYNFVKDGDVFLIDASTQVYKKINTAGDASFYQKADQFNSSPYAPGFDTEDIVSNTQYGFNYISPQPLSDDDNLVIYKWGNLNLNWK